jgi:hypothetical protein
MRMSRSKAFMVATHKESRAEGGLVPFEFSNAHALVHNPNVCRGEKCALHNPSDHSMLKWPMLLRETGLVERTCEHGIGHPDPDSMRWMNKTFGDGWGIHGCDGCCFKSKEK